MMRFIHFSFFFFCNNCIHSRKQFYYPRYKLHKFNIISLESKKHFQFSWFCISHIRVTQLKKTLYINDKPFKITMRWKLFRLCVFSVWLFPVSAVRRGGWRVLEDTLRPGCSAAAAWGRRKWRCPPLWRRLSLCLLCQHDPFDQYDACSLQHRTQLVRGWCTPAKWNQLKIFVKTYFKIVIIDLRLCVSGWVSECEIECVSYSKWLRRHTSTRSM